MQHQTPPRLRLLRAVSLTILTALAGPLMAGDVIVDPFYDYRDEVERGEFSYDDSQDIPWIENETEILSMPRPEDLSPVRIDKMPAGMALSIDTTRIDVNPEDRVVRLWLWVRSGSGVENGTYEGFRCETSEYKVYAYANPRRDPPVTKAKRPRWISVKEGRFGDYRRELLRDYFCGIRGTRSAREIRDHLTGQFRRESFMSN